MKSFWWTTAAATTRWRWRRRCSGVRVHVHEKNMGYGGNQKTCYRLALGAGADIVIMLHPDYQYTPKLIPAMASIIANGVHPCVLGSRILGGYSLRGGMPVWKYVANRFLTAAENILLGAKLFEYHTGYRAFSRLILETLNLSKNSPSLSLPSSSAPFQPILTTLPEDGVSLDWSVSLYYSGVGGISTTSTASSFAVDAGGNLWITDTKNGTVAEWNAAGAAISPLAASPQAVGPSPSTPPEMSGSLVTVFSTS